MLNVMHYACLRLLTVSTASTSFNPTNEHSWTAPIFLASLQTQKQTDMIQHNNHNTHFHCGVQLFKRIRTTGCKKFVSHIIRNNLKVHWMGKSVSKKLQTKIRDLKSFYCQTTLASDYVGNEPGWGSRGWGSLIDLHRHVLLNRVWFSGSFQDIQFHHLAS